LDLFEFAAGNMAPASARLAEITEQQSLNSQTTHTSHPEIRHSELLYA
jgi:hypothetical protein